MMQTNHHGSEFLRMLAPLRKEKLLVFSSILVGSLAAVLNLSRPILLGYIISELVSNASLYKVFSLVSLFTLSWIMTWVASFFIRYLSSVVSQRTLVALQLQLLKHFLNLPVETSNQVSSGKLEAHTNSDLPLWVTVYGSTLAEVTHSITQLIAAAITLLKLDLRLSSIVAPFLIISALIPVFTSKYMMQISRSAQDGISNVLERLTSIIHGVPDLISFGAKPWALERYKEACNDNYHKQVKRTVAQGALSIASSSTEIIAYILVLAIGGSQVLKHELNVGYLVSYLGTIEMIFFPATYANNLSSSIQNSWAAARRVWAFFDMPVTQPRIRAGSSMQLTSISYTYPGSEIPTLREITCQIEKGKLIAIIGESGSGKSTLLHVLSGLYQPTQGYIELFEDNEVSGFVWQEPFLFPGTISENLTLGQDVPLETMRQLSACLNIDETMMRLPSQYESLVGYSGNNFSGGQKKRLAIVRALLRKASLLMMDEPTAGLDIENSRLVWELIEGLNPPVTRIITTHRLDEARRADVVIVMKEGRIVEYGPPSSSATLNGRFPTTGNYNDVNPIN
ncbi:ABC transporter ATP-binding protein [Alicyclobacillus fodiniaquatilis]|uniref:ABC transporter ATP-binding protein n=1 Tax=Alicyclobacillus fodiniaquatilis TaxID=1661150 RepID=A0ABW4JEV4_9BACL